MAATYNQTSPYFSTQYSQYFLDVMINRPIPKLTDDQYFTINSTYQYRPDLLAYDLYDNSNLWWIFYQRNPNTLTAPPLDFKSGTQIYLPKISTLKSALGI
jgi:hemolysin-activating ACP:hemolysin acyltransferase